MSSLPAQKISDQPPFPNLLDGDRLQVVRRAQDEMDSTKRNSTAGLLAVARKLQPLFAVLGGNFQSNGFQARYLTDAQAGYTTPALVAARANGITAEMLLRERSQQFHLGNIITVDISPSGKPWVNYRLEYDGATRTGADFPGLLVYRTGDHVAGELLPAKLVEVQDARDITAYVPRGAYTGGVTYQQYDSITQNGATYYRPFAGAYVAPAQFVPADWLAFGAGLYSTIDWQNELTPGVNLLTPGINPGNYGLSAAGGKSYVLNGVTVELFDPVSQGAASQFFGRLFRFRVVGTAPSTLLMTTVGQTIDGAASLTLLPHEWLELLSNQAAGGYTVVGRGRTDGKLVRQSPDGTPWEIIINNAGLVGAQTL